MCNILIIEQSINVQNIRILFPCSNTYTILFLLSIKVHQNLCNFYFVPNKQYHVINNTPQQGKVSQSIAPEIHRHTVVELTVRETRELQIAG